MIKNIGICIDNQQTAKYPVDYISDALDYFDNIFWFTSDDAQVNELEKYRGQSKLSAKIKIIKNGIYITTPNDIARAQIEAIGYLRIESDVACIIRADMYPSLAAIELLDWWVSKKVVTDMNAISISGMMCKLFCETWREPYVLTAIREDGIYRSIGDGGYEPGVFVLNGHLRENDGKEKYCYDLGYIGSEQYYNKQKNHIKIWGTDEHKSKFIELYESGDKIGALLLAIKQTKESCGRPLIQVSENSFWYKIVSDLKLEFDFELVKSIIKK